MANRLSGSSNEPLKIQLIADPHYYSRKIGTEGKAYKKAESKSQKLIKDSDLAIKAGVDMLCGDTPARRSARLRGFELFIVGNSAAYIVHDSFKRRTHGNFD